MATGGWLGYNELDLEYFWLAGRVGVDVTDILVRWYGFCAI